MTYYDPTFPRRAGLTARADYSILQHHQKVHQHAVMKTMKTPLAERNLEQATGTLTNAKLGTHSGKPSGETTADIGDK